MEENQNLLGENAEEVETAENLEEQQDDAETVDYSAFFQDIITNQEEIISNQEALIMQNTDILANQSFQNNALKGMTNTMILTIIVFCGFAVAKNIFIKIIQ